MHQRIKPLMILLAIGFICQNFGPLSYDLGSLLSLTTLLIYFFICTPVEKKSILHLPIFVIFALILLRFNDPLIQLSGLSALLFFLTLYATWQNYPKEEHVISLFTAVFFTLMIFLYRYFSECWYLVELYARQFSSVCGFVFSRTLNLGPTSFGFFILLSFLVYHCVLFALSKKRSTLRFSLALLYLFCVNVFFVGINLFVSSIIRSYTLAIDLSHLYTQIVLFLMFSLSILFQKKGEGRSVSILPDKRIYKYAIPCLIIFAASLVWYLYPFPPSEPVKKKSIVFYKKGSLDWNTPKFGSYGQRSGGMFGMMPRHLKELGFRTRLIDTIIPLTLSDADVLVMINLNKKLGKRELFTIWNFVKNGGGLLLLGDHTNLGGLMQNFNHILRAVNIKFKFDSAMPSRYTWDFLMDVRPHVLTNGFQGEIGRSWWVGASLTCKPPAVPLVIGRYCYSDWGYKDNVKQAYLGNRKFDYYEPLNDVVLAAYARYGKGKIMVCGDTSAFHNTTFMTTQAFVVNTFNVLSESQQESGYIPHQVVKIILIISMIGCALFMFIPVPNLIIPLTLISLLCSIVSYSEHLERQRQINEVPFDRMKVAYLDYYHKGRFDLMSWEEDSIGGLRNNILRNGFFPLLLKDFNAEKLLRAKLLIIIAPTQPFTENEVKIVKDFVKGGGKVLLTVGWEEREASLPLLESFGLGIDNIPLGWGMSDYKNTQVRFHEAWPMVFDSSEEVEVTCKLLDFPVIVSKRYGKGVITVISDSYFLLNENLEGSKKYFIPNIFLFRDLVLK